MPENTPGSRDNNLNPVSEQVPHSGVHGHEQPVYNFDGQSLQDALDRGDLHVEYDEAGKPKIVVPDTLADHADPTKSEPTAVYEPLTAPAQAPEKKSRRGLAAIAAGVVGATVLGGFGAVKMFGGEPSESDKPRVEPSVSATPLPEADITPTNTTETEPLNFYEMRMLNPSGTPETVLADYSAIVSAVINDRVEGGTPVANEDIQYLVNPAGDPAAVGAFEIFVRDKVANVQEARRLRQQEGVEDSAVDIYIAPELVASEPDMANGGFTVVSKSTYEALDGTGSGQGTIIANVEYHRITFEHADVMLPNGNYQNTFTVSGFETLDQAAVDEIVSGQ